MPIYKKSVYVMQVERNSSSTRRSPEEGYRLRVLIRKELSKGATIPEIVKILNTLHSGWSKPIFEHDVYYHISYWGLRAAATTKKVNPKMGLATVNTKTLVQTINELQKTLNEFKKVDEFQRHLDELKNLVGI